MVKEYAITALTVATELSLETVIDMYENTDPEICAIITPLTLVDESGENPINPDTVGQVV